VSSENVKYITRSSLFAACVIALIGYLASKYQTLNACVAWAEIVIDNCSMLDSPIACSYVQIISTESLAENLSADSTKAGCLLNVVIYEFDKMI